MRQNGHVGQANEDTGLLLENVSVAYGRAEVVSGLDLAVSEGEFVVLLGASGSGKTTALRAIAGFIEIAGGRIVASGRRLDNLPVDKRNVGVVFQDYALFPHMTVRQNVEFGLKVKKVERGDINRRVDEMLELVDLARYSNAKPNALSGGQKQRVALARALVYTPSVLLMDEPLSALDRKLRGGLQEEIRRIVRRAGITTVYVTHDQEEAFSLADRVAILRNGKLTQVATPIELYDNPSNLYNAWFVGDANTFSMRVESLDGGTAIGTWITKGNEEISRVLARMGTGVLVPGKIAKGIVRPENVTVKAAQSNSGERRIATGDGANIGIKIAGIIEDVRAVGSETRYEINVRGDLLKARMMRTDGSFMGSPGDPVEIEIPRDKMLVLPDDEQPAGSGQ